MATIKEHAADARIEAFGGDLFNSTLGTLELTMMFLGRGLGLYQTLRGRRWRTSGEAAGLAGVDERYAREWLEHQAVADVIEVEDAAAPADARRYRLPEEHAIVLLDEDHPAYLGALTDFVPVIGRTLEQVQRAFRTGDGVPFGAYHLHDMQAGLTRPMFASALTSEWLAALPDLHRRLGSGEPARILDVGCGEGWACIYLAETFPAAMIDGFDLDDASIARARELASERGIDERVNFELRDVADAGGFGPYDLVMCCEVVHDLPDPVEALAAMRRAAGETGVVLVIDERVAETFEPSGDPVERLMYGISILHCLPASRDAEESVATGTVMRPATFHTYATRAGFRDVDELEIDHPLFRFYQPIG